MTDPIETLTTTKTNNEGHKIKATIEIHYDECPEDPNEYSDNKVNYFSSASCFVRRIKEEGLTEKRLPRLASGEPVKRKGSWYYGIGAYRHGATHLSRCQSRSYPDMQWDYSPLVGWVKLSEEIVRYYQVNFKGKVTEKLQELADSMLEEYSAYINGECYGYEVTLTAENEKGWTKELSSESCWGFLGDMKYCIEEAKRQAASDLDNHGISIGDNDWDWD